jgi:hypothetical protein
MEPNDPSEQPERVLRLIAPMQDDPAVKVAEEKAFKFLDSLTDISEEEKYEARRLMMLMTAVVMNDARLQQKLDDKTVCIEVYSTAAALMTTYMYALVTAINEDSEPPLRK